MKVNFFKCVHITLFVLLLFGCQSNGPEQTTEQPKFQPLTTNNDDMSQDISNEAKDFISRHEHVTTVYAVNTYDYLLIAFEVDHFDRFQLRTYKDQLTKHMKRMYPAFESVISTDQKIIWELQRIEQDINEQKISINDIQKEIKRLIKLSEDNA